MNNVLSKLKSEKDVEQVSVGLQQLFTLFEEKADEEESQQKVCQEEIHFDFFMEDGIQIVAHAIRCEDLNAADIHRGLELMFLVAEENACHWECIWDEMGKLDGMIHFLETHCSNECLFASALQVCQKLSHFRILEAEAKDILRWMPLWDLLLYGVESFIDHGQVFFNFCHLLESQKDELIPVEMCGRISLAIIRGLDALQLIAPENQLQIPTFRTVFSRFTMDNNASSSNTSGLFMGGDIGSKAYSRCMFIPCSAAA